ncbi:probable inositol transporter 2 [Papaver somniferum]|nr:probable inositol transporter 2 [Papaver somniferum]
MIVACIPAILQFTLVLPSLPESPAWLYVMDRKRDDIAEALRIIYYDEKDVVKEINALKLCHRKDENESLNEKGQHHRSPFMKAWSSGVVRKQLAYGVSLQVIQQSVGINALMCCIPFVIRMWGVNGSSVIPIHDHITCKKYTLLNIYGHINIIAAISSVCFSARCRKKGFNSALGVLQFAACVLIFIFMAAPAINTSTSATINRSNNGSSYYNWKPFADSGNLPSSWSHRLSQEQDIPPGAVSWDCLACVRKFTEPLPWFRAEFPEDREGRFPCPRSLYWLFAADMLCVHIFFVSSELDTFPWTVNSKVYATEIRGLCGAIATMANWISFLVVSLVFFNLVRFLGPLFTLLVLCFIAYFGRKFIESFA